MYIEYILLGIRNVSDDTLSCRLGEASIANVKIMLNQAKRDMSSVAVNASTIEEMSERTKKCVTFISTQ